MTKAAALIFAGGIGVRMNTRALPKQFLIINGKPVLIHTLEIFEKNRLIDGIVLVMTKDWINYTKDLLNKYNITKTKAVVIGGNTGQQSIYNGLKTLAKIYDPSCAILLHDGVRPFIDDELIEKNLETVKIYNGAISAVKMKETPVIAEDGSVFDLPEKERCWIARAPQTFFLKDILAAHEKARFEKKYNFVDSCTLMCHYGAKPRIVECKSDNIKMTTPDDFYVFRALFDKKENEQLL